MGASSDRLCQSQAEVFKAVGHPTRLQIVKFLRTGERTVSDIVKAVGAEQSNVSRHLALLKQSGVLQNRKDGLRVFYGLSCPRMMEAIDGVLHCVDAMMAEEYEEGRVVLSHTAAPASAPQPQVYARGAGG